RNDRGVSFLRDCAISLENDEILILFPEGTRGEPEEMNLELKRGLGLLAKQFPDVEVIPVFLHGLGKSLPKGTMVFVPFFCDVFVGTSICYGDYQDYFMKTLGSSLFDLSQEGQISEWR
ncbi:MAG: 1-acyl-sn-glycerol-3-phosphate acyltransferase, partial [Cohaesibacteraceae bacterium]|nr:1-acyl-sn-glycerol-3-phosphate acyltransferase [Cohaesibacteraceae bacterium]MBL4876292.1 1-acyl-sn-glycerol-3-phosphate acyltransferase [Cohaesibacteraceae bacterium]